MAQFLRIETFGRRARKSGEGPYRNVAGVIDEAARKPTACRHVEEPLRPRVLGLPLTSLMERALSLADTAVDPLGRRLRADGAVLLAGVVSYPLSISAMKSSDFEEERYERWRSEVIAFLKTEFGGAITTVVQHLDEAYPHLHFFALPPIDGGQRLNWDIHPGLRAKRVAHEAGAVKKDQDRAYRDAMKRLQDRFWESVSQRFGHTRTGPRRARYPRRAHLEIRDLKAKLEALEADKLELEARLAEASDDRSALRTDAPKF